ncbi:aminoglycoside phosphotransferase family protein [Streptomyces sp. NPDC016469]|uniref:phosphotransferase family protein n=1 Tax=Streptomyces sp. NPDC016469 TaxID=3157191 RepID=UPI0033E21114
MRPGASPEDAARRACLAAGLACERLGELRQHATTVFLLPEPEGIVVRVSPVSLTSRLDTAVELTRRLVAQRFPASEPADIPQPVVEGEHVVTFWKYYPQPGTGSPPAGHLGALLRRLHELPAVPVRLPRYEPLGAFRTVLATCSGLRADDRGWLTNRCRDLLDRYDRLSFPLGEGLVHGDAYPGNLLWDGPSVRLGDWDESAVGPRELDLANTFQGIRFGRSSAELDDFSRGYGYDIRNWPGLPVLCGMRDLHTLGTYMRRADDGDASAAGEFAHRIDTLRRGDTDARWEAA